MIHYEIEAAQTAEGDIWYLYEKKDDNPWATKTVAMIYEEIDAEYIVKLLNEDVGYKPEEQHIVKGRFHDPIV